MSTHRRFVHVVEARHTGGHRVWLRFDDGVAGEVDLATYLDGEVFAPIRSPEAFGRFVLGDARTLTWPHGADFAPEFLHDLVNRVTATKRVP